MSDTLLDGLEEALARIIADKRREWRKDLDKIIADTNLVIVEMRLTVAGLMSEIKELKDQDRRRLDDAILEMKAIIPERGPPGERGEPGLQGERGLQGEQGPQGERGPPGERGDIGERGLQGERGPQGERGLQGERGDKGDLGERGIDGKDGANGRDGVDGKNGIDGKDGAHGRDGMPGRDGMQGLAGEKGRDGIDGKDGAPGRDGKDGVDIDDLTEELEDEGRYLVRRYVRDGKVLKEFRHQTCSIIPRGLWKKGEYKKGDVVAWDGSYFVAEQDTSSMPDMNGSGWRLVAKRGRDGKDGKPGKQGEPGPRGRDGRDLTQMGLDGKKWE